MDLKLKVNSIAQKVKNTLTSEQAKMLYREAAVITIATTVGVAVQTGLNALGNAVGGLLHKGDEAEAGEPDSVEPPVEE